MSVVISKPYIGPEVERDHPGRVTAHSVTMTEILVLSPFCLDSGCLRVWKSTWAVGWGGHSGKQRGHHAEPLATNLIFISCFMKTARSKALSQELWFISMCVLVAESCPTLCDPMDCSPPDSSVHGIFQARTLEWVAISFSRGSFWPRDPTWVSCIAGKFLIIWGTREARLFQVPKSRLPVMFTSKRQPLLQGNKFTILPKDRGVGNQASGTLRFWDKSQFAGEVSSYFSYFGSFGICIPVFHLHCLSLLEYVQLHALSVRWVWEKEFVRSCSGETRLSTHWPQRPSPQGIRGDKEGKAVGPELRVLTRYLLRVLITAWVCDKSHHLVHLLL